MKTHKILILEDDLEAVSKLIASLNTLSAGLYAAGDRLASFEFDVTAISTYEAVERLINPQPAGAYDVILLDRDCLLGGSFHILDIEKFGPERIISISSTPAWNEAARQRGVSRVVHKDFTDLDSFAERVASQVKDMLLI